MGRHDLNHANLPQLDWSNPDEALSQAYKYAIAQARSAEDWYAEKRKSKRVGGQVLRVGAIVLAGIAALLPILAEILTNDGKPAIAPAWASAALVLAATLIGLDRYFGFSTGWTRFMAAQIEISKLRHHFEFEWEAARVPDKDPQPQELLALARDFVSKVDIIVADETTTWLREFQSGLETAMRDVGKQPDPSNQST